MSPVCHSHLKDIPCRNSLRIITVHFLKSGHQEHLPEHIETVVAGRPVRSDGCRNIQIQIVLHRCDTACQFQVRCRICDNIYPALFYNIEISRIHVHSVEQNAAMAEQPQRVHVRHRRHAGTFPAFLHFFLCLGTMHTDWRPVFVRCFCQTFHQFPAGRILCVESHTVGYKTALVLIIFQIIMLDILRGPSKIIDISAQYHAKPHLF